MRKNRFSKKKNSTPPPPPRIFLYTNFLEIAWNVKKKWNFWKKKFFKFYFLQYLKNSYKIQTTFHQYQKLYSTPPWLGAHTCKVSRKYSNAFLSYSAKTKRDGQTDGQTDRWTDGRTDGRGALQYLPSRAFGAAGDNNTRVWWRYRIVLCLIATHAERRLIA